MEPTKKVDDPEKKTLQLVLEEYTQEQENNTKAIHDLVATVNILTNKIKDREEKLDNPKPINLTSDNRPIQEIMKKGIADIKLIVGTKPVPLIKKYQLLLFPEQDAKLFYKIVFGRWFLFLVLMLLITNLYKFSVHWSDSQKELEREQLDNDQIKKAWYYLYDQENRAGKRLMDSAYTKIAKGPFELQRHY
jgi:hypothetical protein